MHIELVHVTFHKWKSNFWQNYGILHLDNFEVYLQYRVASLCNQLLSGFSSNQKLCIDVILKQIEHMHVTFCRRKNSFLQNYGIFDLDNFEVKLQYGVASLCDQLLPEFSSKQFETLHRCIKHIEHVHVTFCRRKNKFWENNGILDLDSFEVSLQFGVASLCNQLLSGFSSNQFETLHRY